MIPYIFSLKKLQLLIVFLLTIPGYISYGQSIEFKVEDASCNGKEDGKIDIITDGNYTYLWNDNSTNSYLYDIPKGKYWVIITDVDGCTLEKVIDVGVKEDKPKVTIKGEKEKFYCPKDEKEEITLTAEATKCEGCQYKWSTGSAEKQIKVNNDGEYKVMVFDQELCFEKDSIEVEYKKKDCDDEKDDELEIPAPNSSDPNDILGPDGIGPRKWVSVNDVLPYKIRFENDPVMATAPAQKVIIRSPVSPNLDIYSLRLGSFGFGDFVFEAPENTTFYSTRLDVSDSLKVLVDLVAGIDVVKREAFWIFESVDPETNLPPAGDLGFLLVNDTITHRGEGFVTFQIKPDPGSLTGDSIKAKADIIFDNNGSILTPEIFNTIDALPPVSTHKMINSKEDSVFIYAVKAVDDFGINGSGSHVYDLYLSEEDGSGYNLYAQNIPVDSLLKIKAAPDKELCAYTISRDSVGNSEFKSYSDICFNTQVKPYIQLDTTYFLSNYCQGEDLAISWASSGVDSIHILVSSDSGATFTGLASNIPARNRYYSWEIPVEEASAGNNYFLKLVAASADTIYDISPEPFEILRHNPVKIVADNGLEICKGSSAALSVNQEYEEYSWSNGHTGNQIVADTSGWYTVEVKSGNNCSSQDSVEVIVRTPEKPQISNSGTTQLCPDITILLSAPVHFTEYKWSSGETVSTIEVRNPGKYAVSVKDEFGCEAVSDTVSITMASDSVCTVVATANSGHPGVFKLEAFPNPMKEITHIRFQLPASDYASLSLFNLNGLKVADVFNGAVESHKEYTVKFEAEGLIPGIYFCKITSNAGEERTLKILIQ